MLAGYCAAGVLLSVAWGVGGGGKTSGLCSPCPPSTGVSLISVCSTSTKGLMEGILRADVVGCCTKLSVGAVGAN